MEYIPAISLLVASIIVFLAILRKLSGDQLEKLFDGKNFLLIASLILFVVLTIVHLFQNQAWTADVLKVIVGVFVGASAAFATDSSKKGKEKADGNSVDASGNEFGDNAKIAGRDINETIENMKNDIAQIKDSVVNQYASPEQSATSMNDNSNEQVYDYLLNTIYERFYKDNKNRGISEIIQRVMNRWQLEGWRFITISSDYNGIDGMIMLFTRPSADGQSKITYYHGSQMERQ